MTIKRRAQIGDCLFRKNKLTQKQEMYGEVIDRIEAPPTEDGTVYFAILYRGLGQYTGSFVWRSYFTLNRHGKRHFGQFGPQAPIETDRWLANEIAERAW